MSGWMGIKSILRIAINFYIWGKQKSFKFLPDSSKKSGGWVGVLGVLKNCFRQKNKNDMIQYFDLNEMQTTIVY